MSTHAKLDFSDQEIFIGVDVHKKSWTVSIYTSQFEHKTYRQDPDPDVLIRYLHRHFPGAQYHGVYEAGYSGFWIHDALQARGLDCMVVSPPDVPTKDKERRRKNDRMDSRKLARMLRGRELDPIYVPSRVALEDRSLIRTRRAAIKQQTRLKNQIKGMLSFFGIGIPQRFTQRSWSGAFLGWLEALPMERISGKAALQFYIDELKHTRQRIADLNRAIRKLSQTDSYRDRVALLKSIPGIGSLMAMILLVELVDMNRFRRLDALCSYVGLVPTERSSGEEDTHGPITPRSHAYLRSMLIECAWVAVRKDPALLMHYQHLIGRMSGQRAIIRIARKLLSRIRYVLKNHEPYEIGIVE